MPIGALHERVTLQSATETADGSGPGATVTWGTLATVWATWCR
jgi:head-tail adaptor